MIYRICLLREGMINIQINREMFLSMFKLSKTQHTTEEYNGGSPYEALSDVKPIRDIVLYPLPGEQIASNETE